MEMSGNGAMETDEADRLTSAVFLSVFDNGKDYWVQV